MACFGSSFSSVQYRFQQHVLAILQLGKTHSRWSRRHRRPPANCARGRTPAQGGDEAVRHPEDAPSIDDPQAPVLSEATPGGQSSRAAADKAGSRGTTLFEAAAAASAGEDFFAAPADTNWLAPADGANGSNWWEDLAAPAEVCPCLRWRMGACVVLAQLPPLYSHEAVKLHCIIPTNAQHPDMNWEVLRMLSQGSESSSSGGPVRWDSDSFPDVDYQADYQPNTRQPGRSGAEAAVWDQPRDGQPGQSGGQDGTAPEQARGGWAGSRERPSYDQERDPPQQQEQAGWSASSGREGNAAGQPSRGGRQQDAGRGRRTEWSRGQGKRNGAGSNSGWSTSSGACSQPCACWGVRCIAPSQPA